MHKLVIFVILIEVFLTQLFAQDTVLTAARISGVGYITGSDSGKYIASPNVSDNEIKGTITLGGGLYIKFLPNGKYRGIIGSGQVEPRPIDGTYEIRSNKLNIYYQGNPWLKNGTLKYDASILTFPYYLQFENNINLAVEEILKTGFIKSNWRDNKLYDLSKKANVNEKVSIDGIEALTVGYKSGKTTDDVNLRSRPSTSAPKIEYNSFSEKKSVLKKGSEIYVLAKTPRMEKVGKWENYWYYIEYVNTEDPGIEHVRAWVFGEFIRISDK